MPSLALNLSSLSPMHGHAAVLVVVLAALAAAGLAVWIAVLDHRAECARGSRDRAGRPPAGRRRRG